MSDWVVVYERGKNGTWHAHAADLPVYAVGDTREEVTERLRSAIEGHLEVMRESGEATPDIRCEAGVVSV